MRRRPVALPVAGLVLAASVTVGCSDGARTPSAPADPSSPAATSATPGSDPSSPAPRPLDGRVVVLDPGHQLGNRNFPRQVNRLVPSGDGTRKPCNTTGTATDGGYPEATLTFDVARRVARGLERLGARVVLTRDRNSDRAWGPCVDVRGRAGGRSADLKLSIHADGSLDPAARGFHVIVAPGRPPSRRLADDVRRALRRTGLPYATYLGADGLDVRTDLATLTLSRVPTALVELGNMRNPADARLMVRASGRQQYADALLAAVRAYLR